MPLTIVDRGRDNRVEIDRAVADAAAGTLVLTGDGASVTIGAACALLQINVQLGTHGSLTVGPGSRLAALEVMAVADGHVSIGAGTNFTWHTRLLLHEAGRIDIGAGCLIASDTLLTVSDMHSIIDRATGARINPAADIVVEDRVWLAHQVTVLKGSRIGTGSIVGVGSVVSRAIPPHSLAVGRPAAVIRENVEWRPDLV